MMIQDIIFQDLKDKNMVFTIFKGKKKLGKIQAKNLELAEKLCKKEYPDWTEIWIGDRKVNW
jgi:hypothetical protein